MLDKKRLNKNIKMILDIRLAEVIKQEEEKLHKLEENPIENQIEIIRSKQYIQAATLLINRQ